MAMARNRTRHDEVLSCGEVGGWQAFDVSWPSLLLETGHQDARGGPNGTPILRTLRSISSGGRARVRSLFPRCRPDLDLKGAEIGFGSTRWMSRGTKELTLAQPGSKKGQKDSRRAPFLSAGYARATTTRQLSL